MDDDKARLLAELQAVPKDERLTFLADLPPERRAKFKRILPREDIRKLTDHIDLLHRRRAAPSHEKWIAEARAGKASSPDAMIEALRECMDRLRPQDRLWVTRITETASAGSFSRRQTEVIRGIYARYFGAQDGS